MSERSHFNYITCADRAIAEQASPVTLEISSGLDEIRARRAARDTAACIGFDKTATEEIVIAVSELASNLARHATGGILALARVDKNGTEGISIVSRDTGPGIADVEQALTDGYSTVGGLGCGLGTVNRLMDEFEIKSNTGPDSGTHIVCTRWLRAPATKLASPLSLGAATRSHPMMFENGDAFVIKRGEHSVLAGVIDGLGHGQFANLAAQTARHYVETHFDQSLSDIFRGTGRACRATRGVVMALARFDWDGEPSDSSYPVRLTFASVGNIEARVFGSAEAMNFRVRRGIVGSNAPEPHVTEHRLPPGFVMAMYSDGIRSGWRWEDFPRINRYSATLVAQRLLQRLARDTDDATVLVIKGSGDF